MIKDAKETPGLVGIWQKDEKVWIEIAPEQFGVPYLFTANLSRGVGEQFVYGGMMLSDAIVEFKRIGNTVQLIAKNHMFTGGANAPMAQGVKEGFTDSLLAATTVASQPHPERKTVLIDANALLLTDIPVGERFTVGIHMRNYSFDARNSSIESVRNAADQSSFVVSAHYVNPKATLPPPPGAPPSPYPPFTTLPDGRSLFLGYTYNLAKLPDAMPARRADPRVGHFESTVWDFSSDTKYTAKTHFVNRWRLEKKDPAAAVSEPKAPIVFWVDRTVPEKYRAAVRDGILEWNKAFEQIGFKDAVVVKQQDAEGTVDTYDARHSTVRWFVADRRAVRDRPVEGRPAHRRDPERAGRDSGIVGARRPHVHRGAGAVGLAGVRRVQGVARPRRQASARTGRMRSPRCSSGSTCWSSAARSSPAAPRPTRSSRRR